MKIRIIELMNHYSEERSMADNEPLGRFCAFGYHDAIDLNIQNGENEQMSSWDMMEQLAVEKLNGKFTMQLLACAYDKKCEKEEKKFWEENREYPYYFFIVMRVESLNDHDRHLMNEINQDKEDIMLYFSYEHCEIMAVCRSGTYKEGLDKLMEMKQSFRTNKTYSVFAMEEELLKNTEFWKARECQEKVNVRLSATIKARDKVGPFLQMLRERIGKTGELDELRVYDILGDADLLIEADDVDLKDLLPLYAMGELLTHTNDHYKKAFYNIESRFLVEREEGWRMIG